MNVLLDSSALSEDNQALLQAIREHHPESIAELQEITGRAASNLTRTLHTLGRYGLVELQAAPAASPQRAYFRKLVKQLVYQAITD